MSSGSDAGLPPQKPDAGQRPVSDPGDAALPPMEAPPDGPITVAETQVLAPLAGPMYTPPADQLNIGFYGTDLGITVKHQGSLFVIFGDTWRNTNAQTIDPTNDDSQAQISLMDFPGGDAVDAFVKAHPAAAGRPAWAAAGPPLTFLTNSGKIAPITATRDGTGQPLGVARTPVTAWSNGSDGLFTQFLRLTPLPCAGQGDSACPDGFTCDSAMGTVLGATGDGSIPCAPGEDTACLAPSGSTGFCQDRSSSAYDTSAAGRRLGTVYQHELGNQAHNQPTHYLTQAFNTNKFINPAARTVVDFDPQRKDGSGNDYKPGTGSGAHEKVFLWGRPWFVGASQRSRDARLYFAYLDMPSYDDSGHSNIQFHYFTGLKDGLPQFSDKQSDAVALDLSFPGSDPTIETWDIVGQTSVAYVESLKRWVMFYGGDLSATPVEVMGQDPDVVKHDPEGAIHMRFASQPWGPWSEPQQVLKASTAEGGVAALPSAPNGIVRRPDCNDNTCPSHEAFYSPQEKGFLYGANIIQEWTTQRADGVELYWNVSTWDPYQVVLLKTLLK